MESQFSRNAGTFVPKITGQMSLTPAGETLACWRDMKPFDAILRLAPTFSASVVLVCAPLASAQNPDINGDWWYLLFDVPREVAFEGDTLVNGDAFSISTEKVHYSAGRFQNLAVPEENGPYAITPQLEVRHTTPDDIIPAFMNKSYDLMIWAGEVPDLQEPVREMTFAIRPPSSFTIDTLAGVWDTAQLEVPKALSAPLLAAGSPLMGSERFGSERLLGVSVDSRGIITLPDGTAGGVLIQESGLPVILAGAQKDRFFVNASRDVMIRHKSDVTDDTGLATYLTTVIVKRAQGLKESDLLGQWHYAELSVPLSMKVQGSAGSRTVSGNDDFESLTAQVEFCPNGRVLFKSKEGEASFSWKLTPQGLLEVETDSGRLNLSVNHSRTFMAGITAKASEDNYTGLITLVKYSDTPPCSTAAPPQIRLEKIDDHWQIVWSGGILQSSASMAGPWTDITGATSPMILNTAGSSRYFQAKAP